MRRRELLILGSIAIPLPLAARAQQKTMPMIGYLDGGSPGPSAPFVAAFREGLGKTGHVEGQNVAIEYRWAVGSYDRLPALAADLVGRGVDVIAATDGNSALAARNATATIPIVFDIGADPVEFGLVAGFARPSGSLTGVAFLAVQLMAKRFELLSELAPQASAIGLLVNPNNWNTERLVRDGQDAANAKGVQLIILKAATEGEIDAAFATLGQSRGSAVIIAPDGFFRSRREQLVGLASRHAVPAIHPLRESAAAGGLISYGASITATFRLLGNYAGKILNGAKPADLPIEQPTKLELVVNLKTAKALGLTVPQSILARADEVIE